VLVEKVTQLGSSGRDEKDGGREVNCVGIKSAGAGAGCVGRGRCWRRGKKEKKRIVSH